MSHALIVSNGIINNYSYYASHIKDYDFIICADGAIHHLINMNTVPDLWIGDFDSCNFDEFTYKYPYLNKCDIVRLNPIKDVTDTHFCCDTLIDRGFKKITIWGALGGRCDHMLSNIHLLEYLYKKGVQAFIEDDKNTVRLIGGSVGIEKKKKYLSILPLDESIYIKCSSGLKYPVNDFRLSRDISMGISNEIIDNMAEITIEEGMALIIESDD